LLGGAFVKYSRRLHYQMLPSSMAFRAPVKLALGLNLPVRNRGLPGRAHNPLRLFRKDLAWRRCCTLLKSPKRELLYRRIERAVCTHLRKFAATKDLSITLKSARHFHR